MERDYTQEQKYILAKKRVEKIKGFYIHLLVTVFIIPVLVFFNLKFVPEFHWFYFAIIGMLFGVFFHWLGVFGFDKVGLGKDWEEKKIRELMEENKK
ncbi:2TM domain-containing protein [Tenacibaculum caenipelagi]|uniref:2TM domain-containing protein n=1 Tax=Tenacibaculum caenipelagi TaxID=1325435 RepID=A0A4R6TEH3_9FLAO|nr:2TM domain-containing protein [Tenacibaculum caenipelagi]TDQ27783.1 2TM domain-containing protein [Tenacibaculum caenipelagi]